jgi:hypothetical protein
MGAESSPAHAGIPRPERSEFFSREDLPRERSLSRERHCCERPKSRNAASDRQTHGEIPQAVMLRGLVDPVTWDDGPGRSSQVPTLRPPYHP